MRPVVALLRLWGVVEWRCIGLVVHDCYFLSQVGFESMIPVVRDEGINGNDIEACSDHRAFAKLLPTSDAQEARKARACFDAMQRYFFSVAQTRVSISDSLPDLTVI